MSNTSDRPTDTGISIFSTLEAFKSGLTSSLTPHAAADVCDGWIATIEAANRPELNGIADGLRTLARQLRGQQAEGPASAAEIGATMQRLGAHTAESAEYVEEEHLVEPLGRLGGYLKAAGIALQGGKRPDEIEGISTEADGTISDPTLRSANLAPDLSDAKEPDVDVADVEPGGNTPGTALNPH